MLGEELAPVIDQVPSVIISIMVEEKSEPVG
jgi:hypothetical protein